MLYEVITSKSVRQRMCKVLQGNIRNVLRRQDPSVKVRLDWDKLVVSSSDASPENRATLIDCLGCIPGIQNFLEVQESRFTDLDDIYRQTAAVWGDRLAGKSFCVRVRRRGQHPFSSIEVERYVGGGLNQNHVTGGVRLSRPDLQINLEVEDDKLYLVRGIHPGLGGYPLSTQEDVLSLMSYNFV